jgi:hypothetical protein
LAHPVTDGLFYLLFLACHTGMSQDEVQAAALYLNNLGVIVHFRESTSTRDVVIIDPQFLTKVLKRVMPMSAFKTSSPKTSRLAGVGFHR